MYKNVTLIDSIVHKDKYVEQVKDFKHVKEVVSMPLVMSEFFMACKDYPIVFAKDTKNDSWFATVILGYKENENLMVDEDGKWKEHKYVPAYARKYPFVFIENPQSDQLTLAIEDEYLVDTQNERKLFEEGNKTEYLNSVLGFLEDYNNNARATNELIKQLNEWEILEEKVLTIVDPEKKQYNLNGFYVVNEEKLNHLSKKKKEQICEKNINSLITAHLISISNIQRIF